MKELSSALRSPFVIMDIRCTDKNFPNMNRATITQRDQAEMPEAIAQQQVICGIGCSDGRLYHPWLSPTPSITEN